MINFHLPEVSQSTPTTEANEGTNKAQENNEFVDAICNYLKFGQNEAVFQFGYDQNIKALTIQVKIAVKGRFYKTFITPATDKLLDFTVEVIKCNPAAMLGYRDAIKNGSLEERVIDEDCVIDIFNQFLHSTYKAREFDFMRKDAPCRCITFSTLFNISVRFTFSVDSEMGKAYESYLMS